MVSRPAGRFGLRPLEAEPTEIQLLDEDFDGPDRIVLGDVIIEACGKQRALRPIFTLDKMLPPLTPLSPMMGVYAARVALRFHTASVALRRSNSPKPLNVRPSDSPLFRQSERPHLKASACAWRIIITSVQESERRFKAAAR
jgi:hypothetical protein